MKLSKTQLKNIVDEEILKILKETMRPGGFGPTGGRPSNPGHKNRIDWKARAEKRKKRKKAAEEAEAGEVKLNEDEPDPGYPQNIPPIASDSDYRANENIYNLAMKAQSADGRDEWKELIDICDERARAWEDLSKDSMADEEAGI